jgi:hypothetical protein
MTGGGGYNIENTVRAWALAWSALCGADSELDANLLLGGIMLQTTEWQGGLRDRVLPVNSQQRDAVMPALTATLDTLKSTLFPLHGL